MVYDNSGVYLASGSTNGGIKIFDTRKGSQTHEYKKHRGSIIKLLFHPRYEKLQLFSAAEDNTIKLYDLLLSS